jgi:hypothetical protein
MSTEEFARGNRPSNTSLLLRFLLVAKIASMQICATIKPYGIKPSAARPSNLSTVRLKVKAESPVRSL